MEQAGYDQPAGVINGSIRSGIHQDSAIRISFPGLVSLRSWPDWFDILPCDEMHDIDGRHVYPHAPGIHPVQIRTGCRKWAQMGRMRMQ